MVGCEDCIYWASKFDSDGSFYSRYQCLNKNFHRYMKENYHVDSRGWFLRKQHCEFAKKKALVVSK